jgi:hypothetical protein
MPVHKRKKLLPIILACIVIITILRETGVFDFTLYKSFITSEKNANWSFNSNSMKSSIDASDSLHSGLNDECNYGGLLSNTPVYVTYGSTTWGEKSVCSGLEIKVDNFSHGILWTPLYKSAKFRVTASCNSVIELRNAVDGKLSGTVYRFNGTIIIEGHIRIQGISSYRNAKKILTHHILNQLLREGQEYIRKPKP